MNKFALILFSITTVMVNQAYAQVEEPVCEDVTVYMTNAYGFKVEAMWKVNGTFPNPSKVIKLGDGTPNPSFSIRCPKISIDYDGNTLRMKGDSFKSVTDHIYTSVTTNGIDFFNRTSYKYPNINVGPKHDYYGLNLKTIRIYNGISQLKDRNSFISNNYSNPYYKVIIGYKTDGSELKPLIYEGKVHSYIKEFREAQSIDIFHKNPTVVTEGKGIERVFIDKKNGILEVYKNYEFPEK